MYHSLATPLDIKPFLIPLSAQQPAGCDLRQNEKLLPLYYKMRDNRYTARTIERQQTQLTMLKAAQANWEVVYSTAIDMLSEHTKDLEVTAWLIEAALRLYGFNGLREGFKLAHALCETFWDHLYPMADEEGVVTKITALMGLNGAEIEGTLVVPLALAPLTDDICSESYTVWHYYQAIALDKITDSDKRAQCIEEGSISLENIVATVKINSLASLHQQREVIQSCINTIELLDHYLANRCGSVWFSFSRIFSQLAACLAFLDVLKKPSIQKSPSQATNMPNMPNAADNSNPILVATSTPKLPDNTGLNSISWDTKAQVLNTLSQAVLFFRTQEPHSPVSYLLERAIAWAKTPLPLLLQELIQDETVRNQLERLLGISIHTHN